MTAEERKRAAANLQGNPLLMEVLDRLETDLTTGWRQAQTTNEREAFWFKLQAITLIRGNLNVGIKRALGEQASANQYAQ